MKKIGGHRTSVEMAVENRKIVSFDRRGRGSLVNVTGTLVPIKGPGFHRIPGHSMGFYFLPCDVIPLCLFGHFPVVYIGLLYRVYNPRIDLV